MHQRQPDRHGIRRPFVTTHVQPPETPLDAKDWEMTVDSASLTKLSGVGQGECEVSALDSDWSALRDVPRGEPVSPNAPPEQWAEEVRQLYTEWQSKGSTTAERPIVVVHLFSGPRRPKDFGNQMGKL